MRSSIIAAVSALSLSVNAIDTISAYGSKFFLSSGAQFFIKGVAYQLTQDDPLIDDTQCALDAALMKTLGANTIRVYHVDADADHSGCMDTFADNGIYLFVDLDTFDTAINGSSPTWNQTQFERFAAVMDNFQQYENTAGFFVGNEVLTTGPESISAPYVKAAGRDMKAYRNSKGYRDIPIGYSAADIPALRPNLQNYMGCSSNSSDNLDFFSLNAYEWCGDATYSSSGYINLEANATDFNLPIFFSETGCNQPEPRTFEDQTAILGPEMDGTWSGAIIYEWIEEQNNYGLIEYGTSVAATVVATNVVDGFTRAGSPTPISPDFSNLSGQWATLTPSGVSSAAYSPSNSPPACPAYTSGFWEVSPGAPLPTLGQSIIQSLATATATTSYSSYSSVQVTTTNSSTGQSAVLSGSSSGSPAATTGAGGAGSGTSSAAPSATKKGAASSDKKIASAAAGLVVAMLAVVVWL